MTPTQVCQHHSGIDVSLRANSESISELKDRIADLHKSVNDHQEETRIQIKQYCEQITIQMSDMCKMFADPKDGLISGQHGLEPRVSRIETVWKFALGIATFVGGALVVIGGVYREKVVAAVRWFFG